MAGVTAGQLYNAEAAGLILEFEAVDTLPLVQGSQNHLVQVVQNLLDNAIRYTPAGGSVYIKTDRSEDAHMVGVIVTDTGMGITPEEREHLFERFIEEPVLGNRMSLGQA